MKSISFLDQIRKKAHQKLIITPTDEINGPTTNSNWPRCLTCFQEVEAVHLGNVTATGCEIVAKCTHLKEPDDASHVFEDHYKVRFPFRIEGDPLEDDRAGWAIKRAMADFCPFEPAHMESSCRKV